MKKQHETKVKRMGIKGLTDGEAAFPCIGKLRKGGPKQKKTGAKGEYEVYGKDLDYFRFDSKDERAIAMFKDNYGDEPKEINVRLPYPEVSRCFFTCKEEWSGGGLKHRCDGEYCSTVQVNGKYQRYPAGARVVPCPGDCKEVGRLQVIIPELERFAYVTAETHSINDIVNLHQQLTAIQMTFGRLNGIPLILRRRPEEISTPTQDGKRARREKWMLSIEIDPTWASRQIRAADAAALEQASVYHAIAPAKPYALPPVQEEEPPQQVSFDFKQSDTWMKFVKAIAQANTAERIDDLEKLIRQRIAEGVLPGIAQRSVDREVQQAREKLMAVSVGINQSLEVYQGEIE